MHKKFAVPIALAVTGLVLAGCSTGPSTPEGETVLTISGWADDQVAAALIEQFEADHPGVTVDYTGLPWPGILTQINTELVSGTASDVVVVFPGDGNPISARTLAKGNFLADLSDAPWVSEFSEANQAVMSADGKVLMGANNLTIVPAVYNTEALAAVGATAPTTWSEVLDLCATAQENGKVAYALAAVAGGNFQQMPFALFSTLVYGPDPEFTERQAEGDATFADSNWNEAFAKMIELQDAGCFSADPLGTSLEVAQDQIAKGDALGMVTTSQQIETIAGMAPEGTAFETAAFPATDDAAETFLPVGLGAGYGVNAKAKNPELAREFVDLFLSQEGLEIALGVSTLFPSIPVASYTPTPALAGVAEKALSEQTTSFPDQLWPNSSVSQAFTDEFQKVLGGQTTIEAALAAMDKAYTEG